MELVRVSVDDAIDALVILAASTGQVTEFVGNLRHVELLFMW